MDFKQNQQSLKLADEKKDEIEIEENNLEVSSDDSGEDTNINININNNKKGVK